MMIIIVGAGLSGLVTGYKLKKEGIPFKILESRDRVGGRIHTLKKEEQAPVEMGATWFGNKHTHLKALLQELDIDSFKQYMEGTAFFQPFSTSPAESIQLPPQQPSYRISGGTSNLVESLYNSLDDNNIILNQQVQKIISRDGTARVDAGAGDVFEGNKVVLALPPKLWAYHISFEPSLPDRLMHTAQLTQTWMEDSIKVALTYESPFWRQESLSGTLFSNTGPITELYDHCNQQGSRYALCGFINPSYKQLDEDGRRTKVVKQLATVFGDRAKNYTHYEECVWSDEAFTFQEADKALYPHQNNGDAVYRASYADDSLYLSGAETASEFPGYMDGAVASANRTVNKIIGN